jgi:hypothetical protein
MVQGFLFDWINGKPAGAAVTGHDNLIVQILPDETQAALVFVQLAKSRAEIALNTPIFQLVPIAGFHRVMGNKLCHCYAPGTVNK